VFVALDARGADFDPATAGTIGFGWQSSPLQIWLLAALRNGVVFGSTDAVGVTAGDQTTFFAN